MSKITPKNLSYDNTLPPFLARLQANNNSRDGRHEFTVLRPSKKRSAEDEAEDEPVYFNEESGETLTKSEWEAREKFTAGEAEGEGTKEFKADEEGEGENAKEGENGKEREKEKVAAIGAGKKKKIGRLIGADEDRDEEAEAKERGETALGKAIAASTTVAKPEGKKVEKGKTAKKGKKVKLSFDD